MHDMQHIELQLPSIISEERRGLVQLEMLPKDPQLSSRTGESMDSFDMAMLSTRHELQILTCFMNTWSKQTSRGCCSVAGKLFETGQKLNGMNTVIVMIF